MPADGEDDGGRPIVRRQALGLVASGLAGLAAGCPGLFDGGETPTDGVDARTPVGTAPGRATATGSATEDTVTHGEGVVRHVGLTPATPSRVQYNPHNPTDQPAISQHVLFEPLAKYYYADDAFRPAAVTSWELQDGTVRLTLREDLVWTDGTAVTAADLATQLRIARYVEDPIRSWAKAVRTPDSHTVAIDVDGRRNTSLLARDLFADRFLRLHRDRYGPYLEDLHAGNGPDSLREFTDPEPITCGPFRLQERDVARLVTERFEGHPDASAIGVEEYAFRSLGAEGSPTQALRDLTVDSVHSHSVPASVVTEFPDAVESVTTPAMTGAGLVPNHAHEYAGDRAVRRAIAYAVDRTAAVERSRPLSMRAPPIPTALASGVQAEWLGDSLDAFEAYGPGRATDAATSVLQAAGYERRDGTWHGPSGAVVSLPVTYPDHWLDWRDVAASIVADLSALGVDATLQPRRETYRDALAEGEFVLAVASWLPGGRVPHPYRTLAHQLWAPALRDVRYRYPGASTADAVGGQGAEITVPARDGGGTTTVDVQARLGALARATAAGAVTRHVRDLAWVANRDLPMIPVVEGLDQQWLTDDDWVLPDDLASDPNANVTWAPTWLARQGLLQPAE